jgi:hypothetical protein
MGISLAPAQEEAIAMQLADRKIAEIHGRYNRRMRDPSGFMTPLLERFPAKRKGGARRLRGNAKRRPGCYGA